MVGATRMLYFVSGANRAYVLGTYRTSSGSTINVAIPVYYVVDGSQVMLYPMERSAVSTSEACSIIRNAGFGGSNNFVFAVLDNRVYDCRFNTWLSITVGWTRVASSVTTASLYPSPTYYSVSVTSGSSTVRIILSYWYVVDADPGFFAVRPG